MFLLEFCSLEALVILTTLTCSCARNYNITKVNMTVINDHASIESSNSVEYYGMSKTECAVICVSADQCCGVNYREQQLKCTLNKFNCFTTVHEIGTVLLKYPSEYPACTDCIHFGSSSYRIISTKANWIASRDHCFTLGGKLAEIETKEENDFLKAAVLGSEVHFYLGGYNFNEDGDLEWNSKPNQAMVFTDWAKGSSEPNGPSTQRCLFLWRSYNFEWGDCFCYMTIYSICEFE